LIAVETILKEAAKTLSIREIKLEFNGLEPASGCTIEMLFGDTNPQ